MTDSLSETAARPIAVVKLGGSLLEQPQLGSTLRRFLESLDARPLVVVGGGRAADLVRDWDRIHQLGDDRSHWLAIRAMEFNARLMQSVLPGAQVCRTAYEWLDAWRDRATAILDVAAILSATDRGADALPHTWGVTSDTIALRLAQLVGAAELVLLKATSWDHSSNWAEAARCGIVDSVFPSLANATTGLRIRVVNFCEVRIA